MHTLVEDIGIAVIVATIIGYITFRLRQPMILGYFISGIIVGPNIGEKLVEDPNNIDTISELGLILLLFTIGLELNPSKILSIAKKVLLPGTLQFPLSVTIGLGFFGLLSLLFPFTNLEILYLSIACSLSSTAIVVKMLHDKYEIDSYAGKVTLGILIFQDIWAILVIVVQPNLNNFQVLPVLFALVKALALIVFGFLFSRYILKYIFSSIIRLPEIIVAIAIGWCTILAAIAKTIGLSMEMGALIAGVSISSFPYSMHINVKILPLRDFFLTLFFISLGMKIKIPQLDMVYLLPIILLFLILSRFLIIYPLVRISGSSPRNGFISSLNLSQLSEFSLVIISLGISYKHIESNIILIGLYVMSISAILSSYMIRYNNELYSFAASRLPFLAKKGGFVSSPQNQYLDRDIYILGFHRGARALIEILAQQSPQLLSRVIVIDFNTEVVKELNSMNIPCIYGDIGHIDVLEHTNIENAKVIISTIPDLLLRGTTNLDVAKVCRNLNPNAHIIATADINTQIPDLKNAGANTVLLPYSLIGGEILQLLQKSNQ